MKKYKLLKDMPTVKAGTTFREITRKIDGSKFFYFGVKEEVDG